MSLKDGGMTVFIVLVLVGLALGVGGTMLSKTDDGPMEEAGEEILEYATKIDIDLTPRSREDDNK